MRILIDADGCPVVNICVEKAKSADVKCHIFCDTSHEFDKEGVQMHVVPKGADSADFCLVNFIEREDIVITQDYGLASMALSRGAYVINQDGLEYTEYNIDALLLARHTAKKIRNAGGRLKGNPKRTKMQDENFKEKLLELLEKTSKNC